MVLLWYLQLNNYDNNSVTNTLQKDLVEQVPLRGTLILNVPFKYLLLDEYSKCPYKVIEVSGLSFKK